MTLSEIIKEYRLKHGLSQRAFATRCGITNAHISLLEQGKNPKTGKPLTPTLPMLKKLATGMNMSIDELLATADEFDIAWSTDFNGERSVPADLAGIKNIHPLPKSRRFPVIGAIACGTPIEAVEEYAETLDFPDEIDADVLLRCRGDSMTPTYHDGDYVFIRRQPTVENGQIAAVYVKDGAEWDATLKKVIMYPEKNMIVLRPLNADYEDMIFTGEERADLEVFGIAVAIYRKV